MSLKKNLKTGQASLEYFILLVTVSLVVIAANFLWFSRSPSQVNAQGRVRNIAEDYFNKMVQAILK